jgi:hypothetical protein
MQTASVPKSAVAGTLIGGMFASFDATLAYMWPDYGSEPYESVFDALLSTETAALTLHAGLPVLGGLVFVLAARIYNRYIRI